MLIYNIWLFEHKTQDEENDFWSNQLAGQFAERKLAWRHLGF